MRDRACAVAVGCTSGVEHEAVTYVVVLVLRANGWMGKGNSKSYEYVFILTLN